jgi:hypothetical protein
LRPSRFRAKPNAGSISLDIGCEFRDHHPDVRICGFMGGVMVLSVRLALVSALLGFTSAATSAAPDAKGGFAVSDLTQIKATPLVIDAKTFTPRAEPQRLTLACLKCESVEAVDVLIAKSDDGTEARLRSGETKIATIEANCQSREPDCRIERLDLAGAVGWVSRTKAVGSSISTAVLFKGGDRLIVRSMADNVDTAFANGAAVRKVYAQRIIQGM